MKNANNNGSIKMKVLAAIMAGLMIVGAVASTFLFLFQ